MSIYAERPWLDRYDPGQPADIDVEFASALAMFDACVARDPDAPIIRYLGGVLTRRELDELSGAFEGRTKQANSGISSLPQCTGILELAPKMNAGTTRPDQS